MAHVEVLGNLLFIEEAVVATAYIDKLAEPVEVYSGDGDAKVVGKAGRISTSSASVAGAMLNAFPLR